MFHSGRFPGIITTMLASLLPGMRHFRTPFAVGAVLAFQLWVAFGKYLPTQSEAHGLLHRIYSLGEVAGRPIVTAVIAFVLYLLGDMMRLTSEQVARVSRKFRKKASFLSRESQIQLFHFAAGAFRKRSIPRIDSVHELMRQIRAEFPDIRMRLIANHADIYLEHDRLDSEAEFRFNIAIISALLWIFLAVSWSPWFLSGFIASGILYDNGLHAMRDANAILVQSVVSGIVVSRNYEEELQRDQESDGSVSV